MVWSVWSACLWTSRGRGVVCATRRGRGALACGAAGLCARARVLMLPNIYIHPHRFLFPPRTVTVSL